MACCTSTRAARRSRSRRNQSSRSRTSPSPACISTTMTCWILRGAQAIGTRRAEITDVNQRLPATRQLRVETLGRGVAWLDTGTHESLLQASMFIEAIETPSGAQGLLPRGDRLPRRVHRRRAARTAGEPLAKTGYGAYLLGRAARTALIRGIRADRAFPTSCSSSRESSATSAVSSSKPGIREVCARPASDADFVQDNHSRSAQEHPARPALPDRAAARKARARRPAAPFSMSPSICGAARPHFGLLGRCRTYSANKHMLWVPPGFAHGFLALSDNRRFHLQVHRLLRSGSGTLYSVGLSGTRRSPGPCRLAPQPRLSAKDPAAVAFRHAEYLRVNSATDRCAGGQVGAARQSWGAPSPGAMIGAPRARRPGHQE